MNRLGPTDILTTNRHREVTVMKIRKLDIYTYRANITQQVVTSFSTIPSRAMALIRVEDSDGAFGWGEIWGNFPIITIEHRAKLAAWMLPSRVVDADVDDEDPGAFCTTLRRDLHVLAVLADEPGPWTA